MKIISFTMVNNESEIIESFIRYNYNFFDEMVIIDNGCTDNTIHIINNLIREGYKITIFDESLESYNQFRLDNKYLNYIIKEKNPDIIVPLDADEFITGDANPRELMEQLPLNSIYYVHWQWYVLSEFDDVKQDFIPLRMQYCLDREPWNYSDGTKVTKTIIPTKYYVENKLTLSMGHHTVFGLGNIKITELDNIKLAHYRAISELQIVSKTCCYTMRDIATMSNNYETAQRTNQLQLIESGADISGVVNKVSYGGYDCNAVLRPLNLSYCDKDSLCIKYPELAHETLSERVMKTGREMAIKVYNLEREKNHYPFVSPIIVWMDGIRGDECIFPNPSISATLAVERYNVIGYVTDCKEIKYLKANFRLIVGPEEVKFLPHDYIVVPNTVDIETVYKILGDSGLDTNRILTLEEYKRRLGIVKRIFTLFMMAPHMFKRAKNYVQRNGIKVTIQKLRKRNTR